MNKAATGRRTLLQSGLALLGGGLAIAAGSRWSREAPVEAAPAHGTFTLWARVRPVPTIASSDGRTVASGQLLDAPQGKHVGEFSTNAFCLNTPFGPHALASSNVEMQVLQLKDGTLFGMSASGAAGGPKVHAIIGGTARYAGARGTYVQQPAAAPSAAHDLIEFVISIA